MAKYIANLFSTTRTIEPLNNPGNIWLSIENAPPPYSFAVADLETMKRSQNCRVIAVMEATGSGKSTPISKLSAKEITIGHSLQSCTEEIEEVPCKLDDENYVVLVDTPGFNDTNASYGEKKLSGIVYLHSISDIRRTGASITNLRMFGKLVGDENLNNMSLATTRWGLTPYEDVVSREEEPCSKDAFWKTMIAGGSADVSQGKSKGNKRSRNTQKLMKEAEAMEEEQRLLHLGTVEALEKRVKELKVQGKREGTFPPNKQGFWHL